MYEYDKSIDSRYHKEITENFSSYEKEIYKYERMLDEYQIKLNKVDNIQLGRPEEDIKISKERYYSTFFGNNKTKNCSDYFKEMWKLTGSCFIF